MDIQQTEKHPKATQHQYGRASAHHDTQSSNPRTPLGAQLQTVPETSDSQPSSEPPQTDDPTMPQWMSRYLKMHPPKPPQYTLPVLPNTKDWMYWPPVEYLDQLALLPDDLLKHIPTQVPQAIRRSEGRTLGPYCKFHPPIDFVPFEKWVDTQIPKTSPLYSLWYARDWEDWDGYRYVCALPHYFSRSQAGLKVREGFGVPGRIIPIAHQSDYGDHNMIFTTTANPERYYMLQSLDQVYELGTCNSLEEFWTRSLADAKELQPQGIVGMVSARAQYVVTAVVRVGGRPKEILDAMARGGKWWDIFQKDETLRPLLPLFAPLVAYERKLEEDPNWVPTKEYLSNNPLEYCPRC